MVQREDSQGKGTGPKMEDFFQTNTEIVVNKDRHNKHVNRQPGDEDQLNMNLFSTFLTKVIEERLLQNEENSYKKGADCIDDEQQFFNGQELYDNEKTGHKLGNLVPHPSQIAELLHGREDTAIFADVCALLADFSLKRIHAALILLFMGYAGNPKALLHSHGFDKHHQVSSGRIIGFQAEDFAEQVKNDKKTAPLGSGRFQGKEFAKQVRKDTKTAPLQAKEFAELVRNDKKTLALGSGRSQAKEFAEQVRNDKKTVPLSSRCAQKKIIDLKPYNRLDALDSYLSEGEDSDLVGKEVIATQLLKIISSTKSDPDIPHEDTLEMVVSDGAYGRSVVVTSRTGGQLHEIYHLVYASKTSQHSLVSCLQITSSLHFLLSLFDSFRRFSGSGEEEKEFEEMDFSNIDKDCPRLHDLKIKNSEGLHGGHSFHEEDVEEEWRNFPCINPMLKIDAACLGCYVPRPSINEAQQAQQAQTALHEPESPAEDNSGAELSAAVQNPSAEDGQKPEDSSTADESKAEDSEQQGVEELPECDGSFVEQTEASDECRETSHDLVSQEGDSVQSFSGSLPESREGASAQSVSTHTTVSGSSREEKEKPEGCTGTTQATDETVSQSGHLVNRGIESSTIDNSSGSEFVESVQEDSESGALGVSHGAGPVTSQLPTISPFPQESVDGSPVRRTPNLPFPTPVQVSSQGHSESTFSFCSDFYGESYERSFISTLTNENRGADWNQNHSVMIEQESECEGAYGGRSSLIAQEQASFFRYGSPAEQDTDSHVVEETVFSLTHDHPRYPSSTQGEHHVPTQSGVSAPQESPCCQGSLQSESRQQPLPAPPPVQSDTLPSSQSLSQTNLDSSHPPPVQLPPITVHAASSLPPWVPTTSRIDLSQAADRQFAQLRRRRGTYDEEWPTHSGIDAANMALSGFFRIGQGRRVRCFYCGLELDHLTSTTNIWDEHVRHSPECVYLNAVMGRDFVLETLHHLQNHHQSAGNTQDHHSTGNPHDHHHSTGNAHDQNQSTENTHHFHIPGDAHDHYGRGNSHDQDSTGSS